MNLRKMNRYLEIFWWIAAAVTFLMVLIMCFVESFDKWIWYMVVPGLAILMALVRRFMGKKLAESDARKEEAEKKMKGK